MADRVSASISIGCALASALLPDLITLIEDQGLPTEWDGEPFTPENLPHNAPLDLMAHEVAWGRFEELEAFCVTNALPFSRWSGVFPASGGAERVVFSGSGDRHPTPPTRMTIFSLAAARPSASAASPPSSRISMPPILSFRRSSLPEKIGRAPSLRYEHSLGTTRALSGALHDCPG